MIVLRMLVRLVAFLLLVVLALVGLVVLVVAVDPSGGASLLRLPQLRDVVGSWLDALQDGVPTPIVDVLAGAGAVLLGLVLLAGLLVPRRERLVALRKTGHGTLAARRRALAQVATGLVEQGRGVTEAKVKVKPRRRTGGRLRVRAARTGPAEPAAVQRAITTQLEGLTGPFKLKTSVRLRAGGRGARVQ